MVDRALRMREVAGSMPASSTNIRVMLCTSLSCLFLLVMVEKTLMVLKILFGFFRFFLIHASSLQRQQKQIIVNKYKLRIIRIQSFENKWGLAEMGD